MLYCDKSHYQNFTPPFPIPASWQWVRLGEIGLWQSGATPSKSNPNYFGKGFPWLNTGDLNDWYINSIPKEITPLALNETSVKLNPKGSVLIAMYGATIGKLGILNIDATTNQACCACYKYWINQLYLFYFLLAWRDNFIAMGDGGAQSNISKEKIESTLMPLPPLYEQHRIVSSIQAYLRILNSIESNKETLTDRIAKAKSKILDLAMQGKLVPQDPADEPAADMLRRVNPKAKIITDNPQCRNLPLGWTLCQLRDLCSFLSRGKSPKYSETPNQYPVFAQKCNLKDGDISLTQARFLDENTISKWPEKYRLRDGDVLVNSTGTGTVGRTRMFKSEYLGNYPFVVPDSHVSVVRSFDEIESTFIFYSLYCQDGQQYFDENLAGSTNQKELYIEVIGDRNIMLPPINEQKRIAAKIEELYSVLDQIEASLQS